MRINTTLLIAALMVAAGQASAQMDPFDNRPPPPPQEPGKPGAAPEGDPMLGGPRVRERAQRDGERGNFAGEQPRRGMPPPGADDREMGVLVSAVRRLGRAEDPSLQLTEAQKQKLRTTLESLRAQRRAYLEKHQAELKTLRTKAGLPERPGGEGPMLGRDENGVQAQGEMDREQRRARMAERMERVRAVRADREAGNADRPEPTPEQKAARERIREIMQGAPGMDDARTLVFAVLTPEQQKAVETALTKVRERAREGRERGAEGERGQRGARERAGRATDPADG